MLFQAFNDIVSVFFPKTCLGCSETLGKDQSLICTYCIHNLPFTEFHRTDDNPLIQLFSEKNTLEFATSLLFFRKGSIVQNLLHQLKYNGHQEIGYLFGIWMAENLKSISYWKPDVVIPVPISSKRLKKRGYNQVASFAKSIANYLGIPVDFKTLVKTKNIRSQVSKKLEQRLYSLEESFKVSSQKWSDSHILLVDDLITTGSTINACTKSLLKNSNTKISVATIAIAR